MRYILWGLIGFYLIFLFKSPVVPQDKKALWAVVLFLGNMLAMPVFWYLYIWRPTHELEIDDTNRSEEPST